MDNQQRPDHHPDELVKLRAPLRNAEISLIDRGGDEVPLVELRIREGKRITTVEIEPATARALALALTDWVDKRSGGGA